MSQEAGAFEIPKDPSNLVREESFIFKEWLLMGIPRKAARYLGFTLV